LLQPARRTSRAASGSIAWRMPLVFICMWSTPSSFIILITSVMSSRSMGSPPVICIELPGMGRSARSVFIIARICVWSGSYM